MHFSVNGHLKERHMKLIILIIFTLIIPTSVFAQSISGKVRDNEENILPYANIGIVGLNRGTISNLAGEYSIDISDVSNDKVIRFSSVGYKSVDFKIEELKSQQNFKVNVELNKIVFSINEIVVKPEHVEPIFLGSKKKGIYTSVWNKAKKGAEIGTLFNINKTIFLEEFMFHVKVNNCDSIYYRLRIYDGEEKSPLMSPKIIINKEDIRFISKVRKGWVNVDISDYKVKLESDFIITLETLNNWTTHDTPTTHLSIRNVDARSFSRQSSMDKWTQFGDQMSFRIKIREY